MKYANIFINDRYPYNIPYTEKETVELFNRGFEKIGMLYEEMKSVNLIYPYAHVDGLVKYYSRFDLTNNFEIDDVFLEEMFIFRIWADIENAAFNSDSSIHEEDCVNELVYSLLRGNDGFNKLNIPDGKRVIIIKPALNVTVFKRTDKEISITFEFECDFQKAL